MKRWLFGAFAKWSRLPLLVVFAGMFGVIIRSALAGPNTTPRPSDEEAARRVEPLPGAANDLRLSRPEGDWIGGLGVVEPSRPESRLVPARAGRVRAVLVEEGEFVEAGTTLVELENDVERAEVAIAEADVEVAKAELERAAAGLRPEEQLALRQELRAARVRAELASRVVDRLETSAVGGGVTLDALDRAERQTEQDRLMAEAGQARLRAARRGRRVDVALASARLQAAQMRVLRARAELDLLRVVAPVPGEVLQIRYRVGEHVTPAEDDPVIVLGDTRSLRARIDVDERDLARLREGARTLLLVDAFPNEAFEAQVVDIGQRLGRKNVRTGEPTERLDTKILEVVVALTNDDDRLLVGQRVMAFIAPSRGAEEMQHARIPVPLVN
ncbi:MAG: HlyD family efflux transporter periplasmic adaptor subunit [Myxococcota bacterium]